MFYKLLLLLKISGKDLQNFFISICLSNFINVFCFHRMLDDFGRMMYIPITTTLLCKPRSIH